MGLNSQGKNIYLQLHPNFHLTVAAAAAAPGCFCAALADSPPDRMQIEVSYIWNAFIPGSNNSKLKERFRCVRLRV